MDNTMMLNYQAAFEIVVSELCDEPGRRPRPSQVQKALQTYPELQERLNVLQNANERVPEWAEHLTEQMLQVFKRDRAPRRGQGTMTPGAKSLEKLINRLGHASTNRKQQEFTKVLPDLIKHIRGVLVQRYGRAPLSLLENQTTYIIHQLWLSLENGLPHREVANRDSGTVPIVADLYREEDALFKRFAYGDDQSAFEQWMRLVEKRVGLILLDAFSQISSDELEETLSEFFCQVYYRARQGEATFTLPPHEYLTRQAQSWGKRLTRLAAKPFRDEARPLLSEAGLPYYPSKSRAPKISSEGLEVTLILRESLQSYWQQLSRFEQTLIGKVAEGFEPTEIAAELGLSAEEIDHYLRLIRVRMHQLREREDEGSP